jgi:hypothetical protein
MNNGNERRRLKIVTGIDLEKPSDFAVAGRGKGGGWAEAPAVQVESPQGPGVVFRGNPWIIDNAA